MSDNKAAAAGEPVGVVVRDPIGSAPTRRVEWRGEIPEAGTKLYAAPLPAPAPAGPTVGGVHGSVEGAAERRHLPRGRVRHKRRRTVYEVIGEGRLQAEVPLANDESVVLYRNPATGELWARPSDEFRDGRFEVLPPAPEVAPVGQGETP